MDFYTNIVQNKTKFLVRGYQNGKSVKQVLNYEPYLFVPTKTLSKYKTIDGNNVGRMDFSNTSEARNFIKEYEDVEGMPIYGMTNFLYPFIFDNFHGDIKYDPSLISVVSLDIENKIGKEDIATSIATTPNEITAITISRNGKKASFGCHEYKNDDPSVTYYKCKDEYHLLTCFLEIWNSVEFSPEVVTGWNVEFYDIPYLVGRISKVLGGDAVPRLSPWGLIREYDVVIKDKTVKSYELKGITVLDYMALYKKFTYKNQESYRLDHIAFVELGVNKLDYSEYSNLNELYEKNFQLFMAYNIRDVELVDQLDDKLKLIELVFAMAYDAKVNYSDTLASVNQWDVIIHNYLMQRNIVVSPKKFSSSSDALVGGYVKDPHVGLHKWVVSLDLNSLYPHLIQQYNISPETFERRVSSFLSIDDILDKKQVPNLGFAMAANGCAYKKDKQGFLGALMAKMYDDRVVYKKQMIECKREYESNKDPQLLKDVSRFDNLQMAKKIQLNSAYGALGNKYFRWYDINHAEAITMSGQLSIRWIANALNEYLNKICKTKDIDFVIASDTDSVYLCVEKLVDLVLPNETDTLKIVNFLDKVVKEKIEPFVDKSYQDLADHMHAYQQKMVMKRECIADKAIWTAKKRYILNVWNQEGVLYTSAKLKMSGIEAVKSSTPLACRNSIKEAIGVILKGSELDLQTYVSNFRETFKSLTFQEIASPRGVSNITQYVSRGSEMFVKGTPIHVKGSILYNNLLDRFNLDGRFEKVSNGEKIKFCYLKSPNPYRVNVISCIGPLPSEFGLDKYIDYDTQFEKAFLDPLKIIVTAIGWEVEKTSNLESFFS